MDKEYLEIIAQLTKDIQTLKKEMKEHPDIHTSRISSKDVLLYVLPIIAAHDNRLTCIETKLKLTKVGITIAISLSGLIIAAITLF